MTNSQDKQPGFLLALGNPDYRVFFIGQFLSLCGTWMQSVAQGWLILRLTNSPSFLGIVAAAGSVPVLLLSYWGGSLADRYPKRQLMIYCQLSAMVISGSLATLTLLGCILPWEIVLFALVQGCVNAIDAPLRQSYMVQLVGKPLLNSALALNSTAFNSARIIGPAAAGLVVGWYGEGLAFAANTLSFIAVIWALNQLTVPGKPVEQQAGSEAPDLRAVFESLYYQKTTHTLLLLAFSLSIFGFAFLPLLPYLARDVLSLDAIGFGLLSASQGVGALCAAVASTTAIQRGRQMCICFSAVPVLLIALALTTSPLTAYVLSALLGFTGVSAMILTNTTIQVLVPDSMRGRIMSLFTLSILGLSPLGGLIAGICVNLVGGLPLVLIGSAIMTMLTVIPLLIYGRILELDSRK